MDIAQESLRLHEEWQGKLDTVPDFCSITE